MKPAGWTRRGVLATALGGIASSAFAARTTTRIAVIDWAVLETVLALGLTPVAATELVQFRDVAVEPAVPPGVADLGLRGAINYEALLLSRPDIILSSNFYSASASRLATIAPVESFSVYAPGNGPFDMATAMTRQLGGLFSVVDRAEIFTAQVEEEIAVLARDLSGVWRPVIPINLGDERHFRVFGADSMFGAVIERLGLRNAWTQATSYSAMAPIGIEALAQVPDATIVLMQPAPADAIRKLRQSRFWNALPAVAEGRLIMTDPVNPFGGLPAARRFARLLSAGLRNA